MPYCSWLTKRHRFHQQAQYKPFNMIKYKRLLKEVVRYFYFLFSVITTECVLSPYLFNTYIEYIFRESNHMNRLNINGKNINNIHLADDTTVLASSNKDLKITFLSGEKYKWTKRAWHESEKKNKTENDGH